MSGVHSVILVRVLNSSVVLVVIVDHILSSIESEKQRSRLYSWVNASRNWTRFLFISDTEKNYGKEKIWTVIRGQYYGSYL